MSRKRSTNRIVYAVFTRGAPQRLSIPTIAPIWSTVKDLVDTDDNRELVGVLDQYKSKWID
jgi:hypothetical protein